jgi:hypothetical protein
MTDYQSDDRTRHASAGRWLKLAVLAGAIVALLVVALVLAGVGGGHGPGRHGPDRQDQPASEHTPPDGMHG